MKENKSSIHFDISMDENMVPNNISWRAQDSDKSGENNSKAAMLAIWDEEENNTLRIDLWTKSMMVDEMKKFTCQNIITLADSFERATGEHSIANEIREFGKDIAQRLGVLKAK